MRILPTVLEGGRPTEDVSESIGYRSRHTTGSLTTLKEAYRLQAIVSSSKPFASWARLTAVEMSSPTRRCDPLRIIYARMGI